MMLALLAGLAFGAPLDDLVPLAPDARAEVVFDRNVRAITPIAATHSDGSSWVQLITSRSDAVEVTWYDDDLQPADTTLVDIPARTSLRTWARDGDAMFLVFGTFTIAAGVLLSLTIIMLLADVRRTELATARALGLKRSDARATKSL